jgi:hypothetical protein
LTRNLKVEEALMCQDCIEKLEVAFKFAKNIRKLEAEFFGPAVGQSSIVLGETQQQPIAVEDPTEAPKILKRKNEATGTQMPKKVRFVFDARSPGGAKANEVVEVKIEREKDSGAGPVDVQVKAEIDDKVQEVPIRDEVIVVDALPEIKAEIPALSRPIRSTRFHAIPDHKGQQQKSDEAPTTSKAIKEEKVRQSFVCEFEGCGKEFRWKCLLEQHQASHSGEFLFIASSANFLNPPQMLVRSSATAVSPSNSPRTSFATKEAPTTDELQQFPTFFFEFFCQKSKQKQ